MLDSEKGVDRSYNFKKFLTRINPKSNIAGAILGYITVFTFFLIVKPSLFLSVSNLASILATSVELGIVAIGVGTLMIAGEFDISVGSVYGCSGMLFIALCNNGIHSILSFFIVLLVAGFIGFLNGLVTVKGKIPSFIATLGMLMFVRGIMLMSSGGWYLIYKSKEKIILNMLNARVFTNYRWGILWLFFVGLLIYIVLEFTRFGNHVFAVGGNPLSAKSMGVSVQKTKVLTFMVCSSLAGLAGVLSIGRFLSADTTMGTGMELEAIASAAIGGILLRGGFGNILGVIIGALLMSTIRSGLILIGVPGYFYQGILGVVLVITAIINNLITVRRTKLV